MSPLRNAARFFTSGADESLDLVFLRDAERMCGEMSLLVEAASSAGGVGIGGWEGVKGFSGSL